MSDDETIDRIMALVDSVLDNKDTNWSPDAQRLAGEIRDIVFPGWRLDMDFRT